jgi:hypothetical protein
MTEKILNFLDHSGGQGLSRARVLECDGRTAMLLGGHRVVRAELAPSLLLSPRPGDTALLYEDGEGAFLLSILARPAEGGARGILRLPPKSSLAVEELTLAAPRLEIAAGETRLRTSTLSAEGGVASLRFSILSQVASRIQSFARNLLTKAKSAEIKAGSARLDTENLSLQASEDIRARARHVDLLAKGSFRVDGRTINLG